MAGLFRPVRIQLRDVDTKLQANAMTPFAIPRKAQHADE